VEIPKENIDAACRYLSKKGIYDAYFFGSGLRIVSTHDLDIAVDLLPTEENKKRFEDCTDYGIDLFLLDEVDSLFSVSLDDYLYSDEGELQGLESVGAVRFTCPTSESKHGDPLFSCSVEASWLRIFLRAYSAIEQFMFYWLFTKEHIEGRALDPSRTRAIQFRIFPLEYHAEERKVGEMWGVFSTWVEGSIEGLVKAVKRYKVREMVSFEVRDDNTFWVGGVQIGNVIDVKNVPEDYLTPLVKVKADATLRVAVKDFRRIVDSVTGLKLERSLVGFRIKGWEEAVMVFFEDEEKFTRVDIKRYEPWLLEIGGVAMSCYRLDGFKNALVPLSDVVKITIMEKAPCSISYSGDFFDVEMILAPYEAYDVIEKILAFKPPVRRPLFVLRKEEVEVSRDVIRAVDPLFRGAEVWFGVNPYDFWFYWSFYDKGYFKMSKGVFEEWHVDGSYAGSFDLSVLSSWIRDVETLECWLEDETAKAMVLIGKGEKIATKELRSEKLETKLEVPDVKSLEVFKGPKDILSEVFEDAVTAQDDFLVFISRPEEIKVIGQDAIYYRASLPLNGFKFLEEDFVPVSDRFLKPLGDFLRMFPGYVVSIGKPVTGFDIYVGGETAIGEFRALLAQTADEAERAILAYREEIKPPAIPKPEVAKPIPVAPKREDVLEVLRDVPTKMMPHEALVHALVVKNFDKSATLDLIADMIKQGELYEPKPPYIRISISSVEVRLLRDIPQIVGIDFHTYGPYKAGEIALLPPENAEALIKQGVAESPKPQPPKLSLEEFSRIYNEKLDEWIRFSVEGRRSGLAGTLHYEAPEREKEIVAKYTLETVKEMHREEIEKDIPVAYSSYETFYGHGAGDKFMEKWLPDRLHHFGADLAEKTRRTLEEEAKKPPEKPEIVKEAAEAIKELEGLLRG